MRKLLLALLAAPFVIHAQAWPSKPLRYIVPFPPGAFNDTLARTLSAELPKMLGQPVVVENRPGGNTIVATQLALRALLAGQVHVMFDNTPNVLPHVKAGKLKALAVSSKSRSRQAPEVPTVDEGGVPGYDVGVWFGVLTVAGTPREIVQRLNTEMVRVLTSAEVKERFGKLGVDVVADSPEHFSQFLKSEVARWAK